MATPATLIVLIDISVKRLFYFGPFGPLLGHFCRFLGGFDQSAKGFDEFSPLDLLFIEIQVGIYVTVQADYLEVVGVPEVTTLGNRFPVMQFQTAGGWITTSLALELTSNQHIPPKLPPSFGV